MRTIPELEEGTHRALASGTLPDGSPVIVNANGTVSLAAFSDGTPVAGTPISQGYFRYPVATFDSNSNKVVVVYQGDGFNRGFAKVGTVSGTNISFGTAVRLTDGAIGDYTGITFDSNSNKVVITYRDVGNSGYGTAIVGNVNGTTISFGTTVVFNSADSNYGTPAIFDSNSNKVVVAYRDAGNFNQGTARVGTVSGTTISFGTAVVFNTSSTVFLRGVFDSNSNKAVILYRASGTSTAIVGTVSGTNISFGTASLASNSPALVEIAFDSNSNKVVIAYPDTQNSSYGTAKVGLVSGTNISFATAVVFDASDEVGFLGISFDSSSNKVGISYARDTTGDMAVVSGTVSGIDITFSTAVTYDTNGTNTFGSSTFDSNSNKLVTVYTDNDVSNNGKITLISLPASGTSLTTENYIGISKGGTYASDSRATIDVKGSLSTNQSGLTPGQSYFVQTDGTLSDTAGSPSVFAGTAVSATSLLVKT